MPDYSPKRAYDAVLESTEAALDWYRTVAESTLSIQQQNVEFVQNPFQNVSRIFDAYARASSRIVQATAQVTDKQQKALQVLYEEQARAYQSTFSSFYDPFSLFRAATAMGQEMAGGGVRATQQAAGSTGRALRDSTEPF